MTTKIIAGKRFFSGHSCLWTIGLLFCIVTATGCPRMVSLDYQPSNPLRGQGTVGIATFRYQPSDEHRVRPRQVETNPASKTELFLSQEIGVFFSDALRMELSRSGYTMNDASDRFVSGAITRFYLDWRSEEDRTFELDVDYTVQSSERTLFSWHCSSLQKGPNMLAEDGILIRKGTADCMRRFIEAVQEAKAF
ncbi:MAG TPA: hypothetical protein VIY67_04760 [Nitrospiraceae bacterium]